MRSSVVARLAAASCVVVIVAASGCGSSSPSSSGSDSGPSSRAGDDSGPAANPHVTATGTIGGKPFTVGSAFAFAGGTKDANTGPAIGIMISSGAQLSCSSFQSTGDSFTANFTGLEFFAVNNGNAVTPGTYKVGQSGSQDVIGQSEINDASCTSTGGGLTAGTLTITSLSAASVSGSYDLTISYLPSGTDHVSGTFDAPLCTLPDSWIGLSIGCATESDG
jgi:hypothetical protein